MKYYLLAHGFALTNDYWKHLVSQLDGKIYYFGDGTIDPNRAYIGIGHSLGFLKLNNAPFKFSHLIGLQGFLNFCGNRHALRKVIEPKLDAIIQNFEADPTETLKKFYQPYPYLTPAPEILAKKTLLSELKMMKKSYPHCGVPTRVIGTRRDRVIPSAVIRDNFSRKEAISMRILDLNIDHTLGWHSPEIVAHEIKRFTD
ncbi:MAG: hypothetical protein LBQ03_01940 [Puniceicoccales bacterium]|jgi:pimeloyl-[acyl-carrier protein] methyl ester esterase|nr:hypothetical protein [Puniceicoccales bacterium]